MTTTASAEHRDRWLVLLLAAALTFTTMVLLGATAGAGVASAATVSTGGGSSASTSSAAGTRVGVSTSDPILVVGGRTDIAAGQRRDNLPSQSYVVSGCCVAAEATLPELSGTLADSFEGGTYTTQTFKAGTTLYRAEGASQGSGSFLGLTEPSSAADAEQLYNIAKWGNPADVVSTYTLTEDTTMYVGQVAGGTGTQALLPTGVSPSSVLRLVGQRSLG